MPSALFGVENAALSLQIPLDAYSNCSLLPFDPVLHLNTLKKVQVVTGSVAISDCLKLTTLGGGLSRLRFIGSTLRQDGDAIASHLHISNTGLRGSLARKLPTVQEFSLVGEIVNNSTLCAVSTAFSWPPSWLISGNANPAQCGCTFPVALNYNQNALYDDDSCQMTGCNLCHTGTHGPCAFTDTDGDVICSPSLDARTSVNPTFFRCHAGTTACTQDLCKDVICDSAPQCQTVIDSGDGAGMCIEGVCLYNFADEGDPCNDRKANTGPDRCNDAGQCIGQSSCVVAEMGGTPNALYGATVQSFSQLQMLAGCVIIAGNLHIDCTETEGVSGIPTLTPLLSLKHITGALVINGCSNLTSLKTGLSNLESVDGQTFGSSIFLHDNAELSGSLPMELPSLISGESA